MCCKSSHSQDVKNPVARCAFLIRVLMIIDDYLDIIFGDMIFGEGSNAMIADGLRSYYTWNFWNLWDFWNFWNLWNRM